MYNFTKAQLVRFYIEVLGGVREECEACTVQQLFDNLVGDEPQRCAVCNGLQEQ